MSKFVNTLLRDDSVQRTGLPVWWATDTVRPNYHDVITSTILEELFTRYEYVKATATATYETNGEIRALALDADSPIIAVSRDTGEGFHIATHGQGFRVHAPQVWLAETVEPLLREAEENGIRVESAIHLAMGRYSAVSLSRLDPTVTDSGMAIREVFSLLTSQTGELTTCASDSQVIDVCDNTAAASDTQALIRIKHTANSDSKLTDFRAALHAFLAKDSRKATQWVGMLADLTISADEYAAMLENWAPTPQGAADTKGAKNQTTRRAAIHAELWKMYADPSEARVAPWSGTALGAYQALSTWDHYNSQTRGQTRERKLAIARMTNRADDQTSTHSRVLATIVKSLGDKASAVAELIAV